MLSTNANSGIDYQLLVTPAALGDRVGGIAQYFSRFRFNSLKFQLKAKSPVTTPGLVVHGVLDDQNGNASGSSPAQVLDYRVSGEKHVYSDQTLTWRPLDPSKWYYITAGADARLQYPCTYLVTSDDTFYTPSVNVQLYNLDLHYSITFEGAAPNGYALASDYVSVPPTPNCASPTQVVRTNPQINTQIRRG